MRRPSTAHHVRATCRLLTRVPSLPSRKKDSNTFKDTREAGSGLVADADAPTSKPPAKKRKVTQDKAVTAAGSTTIRLPALPGSGSAGGAAAAEAPRNFTPGLRGDG